MLLILLQKYVSSNVDLPKPLSKLLSSNISTTAMTNSENSKEISDSDIGAVRHKPKYDAGALNRAVQRAVDDENFLSSSIKLLEGLKFPAFKYNIVDYATKSTKDSDVLSLFESLEVNDPKKADNQMTDEVPESASFENPHTTTIKNTQAVSESEERKAFPESSPAAMSKVICKKCGKSFQNQADLVRHKSFEEGKDQGKKISDKSRTNRQRTAVIPSKQSEKVREIGKEESSGSEPLNRDMAARMANLLEGLDFPATKKQIINQIETKTSGDNKVTLDNILTLVESKLQDNLTYNNVYEIEKTMNLVTDKNEKS